MYVVVEPGASEQGKGGFPEFVSDFEKSGDRDYYLSALRALAKVRLATLTDISNTRFGLRGDIDGGLELEQVVEDLKIALPEGTDRVRVEYLAGDIVQFTNRELEKCRMDSGRLPSTGEEAGRMVDGTISREAAQRLVFEILDAPTLVGDS